MAGRLQLRRGTTSQNDAFTGAIGELTLDTQKKQIRLHDGSTQGGCGLIDPVVEEQEPTGTYMTWWRKYASGRVEEGGFVPATGCAGATTTVLGDPTFHFPQKNGNYNMQFSFVRTGSYWSWVEITGYKNGTTGLHFEVYNNTSNAWTAGSGNGVYWRVDGYAA